MTKRYYVIDTDNNNSWSDKTESGECFSKLVTARARAVKLAESDPGKTFFICQALESTVAPVGNVESKPL